MKRNPGEWLRHRLLDRVLDAVLLGMAGASWLLGAGLVLGTTRGWGQSAPEWMVWSLLLPGVGFLLAGLYKAKRGWRLGDIAKGARAEETVGQAIEYALTRDACAVAHHVEEIARVGDIDHLVATSDGLWVIETKHGRVPRSEFRETLRRIAANVEGVREWAPDKRVTGCLVFGSEQEKRPKRTYDYGKETIRAFGSPTELMRELRSEASGIGGSTDLARRVWKLGALDPDGQSGPES
ncbi:MAG: NERD domain-containing protein [Gammaproteobacteria bacterium]|nr:NERD domain-containing protein [Gammaproteobacteria bacterium]